MEYFHKKPLRGHILAGAAIIATVAIILLAMGQVPWCKCGDVKLWHGVVFSSENSQHISDWYSFTHITHGFAFYALLWLILGKRLPAKTRLLLAIALEGGWEILENTDFVINRYREVTISLDYYGDSVINSISDIFFMIFGFFLAYRLPVWLSAIFVLTLETMLGFYIRDNLTINIIMLLYPLEWLKAWQTR